MCATRWMWMDIKWPKDIYSPYFNGVFFHGDLHPQGNPSITKESLFGAPHNLQKKINFGCQPRIQLETLIQKKNTAHLRK